MKMRLSLHIGKLTKIELEASTSTVVALAICRLLGIL